MNRRATCQRPNVYPQIIHGGEENETRLGSATVRLWLDFCASQGVLEPIQMAPLLEFCELEMRGVLPLSAGSKLESLL